MEYQYYVNEIRTYIGTKEYLHITAISPKNRYFTNNIMEYQYFVNQIRTYIGTKQYLHITGSY
jgi:hypothetical protein